MNKNCPKCDHLNDHDARACTKCGLKLEDATSSKNAPEAKPIKPTQKEAEAPIAKAIKPKKKKTWVWIALIAFSIFMVIGAVAAYFGYSYFTNIAKIKNFYQATYPDFETVIMDLNVLNEDLSSESTNGSNSTKIIGLLEQEALAIEQIQSDAKMGKEKLAMVKPPQELTKLHQDLNSFYEAIISDSITRSSITSYYYETLKIADDMVKSLDKLESGEGDDLDDITENLEQLGVALDDAVLELEQVEPPESFIKVHQNDVLLLKNMSKSVTDMITALEELDLDKFNASYNKFESTLSEYDNTTKKTNSDLLKPEFDKLNQNLLDIRDQKNDLEERFANLAGQYGL